MVTEVAREGSLEERIALAARAAQASLQVSLQASLQADGETDSEADTAAAAAAAVDCLSWELRVRVLLEVCAALDFLHCNEVCLSVDGLFVALFLGLAILL